MAYDYVGSACTLSSVYNTPGAYATLSDCQNAVSAGTATPILILNPLWNASKKGTLPLSITKLGDAYQQIVFQGKDQIEEEWNITSPILFGTQVEDLMSELRSLAGSAFLWSPNNGIIPYRLFSCNSWRQTRIGISTYQISAKFTLIVLGSGQLAPAITGIASSSSTSSDPNFSNVILLIQPQSGDTAIKDYSSSNQSITSANNPAIAPLVFVPGSKEYVYFNKNSSDFSNTSSNPYLLISSTAFNFGTGDFTIEGWVFLTDMSDATQNFFVINLTPFINQNDGNQFYNFNFSNGKMNMYIQLSPGDEISYPGNTALSINQLYHVAWVRQSGVMRYYINGILDTSFAFTININPADSHPQIAIGHGGPGGAPLYAPILSAQYFPGYFTLRISNIARYTSSFIAQLNWPIQ